ncbi:MAG TPA: hypothetical protein VK171_15880 [Fimbriimonas sp.]|nr:hypothetical protein [Fimbriimonas sp.]
MKLKELKDKMRDQAMPYVQEYGLSGSNLELFDWVKEKYPDKLELVMAADDMIYLIIEGEREIPDRYLKYVTEMP